MSSPLLDSLNPEQRAAVTLPPEAHALILAGAGSGKTSVLTSRMVWLIEQQYTSPLGMMAVTFTNKAAREMNERVAKKLKFPVRGMWIGTFHGLCNRILRAHHRDAGLPQTFQILDTADQLSAVKRLFKNLGVSVENYPPREFLKFVQQSKEQGLRPEEVPIYQPLTAQYVEWYKAYEAQCQREGVVDFSELLLRCFELLSRNEVVRTHYQDRFKNILVDEFQDTNVLQYRWIQLLAKRSAVFAVGDDDQSIYGFRGANVDNMQNFQDDFAKENTIRLEQNYRSYGNILQAANTVIAYNNGRLGKNLWTEKGHGEPIRIYEAQTDTEEAQWLVEEVRQLLYEGRSHSEIAVLYRSNAQSRALEHALFTAGITYRVYGGLRFFERQEVKNALAYLRLMENPHDDTAWVRVVNFPPRGIGARSLEQLTEIAQTHSRSLYASVALLSGRASGALVGFVQLLDRLRFETQNQSLPTIIQTLLEQTGLRTHYQQDKEGEDRLANLEELVNAATAFEMEYGSASANEDSLPTDAMTPMAAFLSHASLEAGDNQAQEGQSAVQLMTVHASKGLEFEVVFITGVEEGIFPHENSLNVLKGLEEERRLMYVAITRARERLYVSFAQSRLLNGQVRYLRSSSFIEEIPGSTTKWITPRYSSDDSSAGYYRQNTSAYTKQQKGFGSAEKMLTHVWDGKSYAVGQTVQHSKFGEGVILRLQGTGEDMQAHIQFKGVGVKTLLVSAANLQ